jgi:hypothetical protein
MTDASEATAASLTSDAVHLDHGVASGSVHRRSRRFIDDQECPTEGQRAWDFLKSSHWWWRPS